MKIVKKVFHTLIFITLVFHNLSQPSPVVSQELKSQGHFHDQICAGEKQNNCGGHRAELCQENWKSGTDCCSVGQR